MAVKRIVKILLVVAYAVGFGEAYCRWLVPKIMIGPSFTISDADLGWVGRPSFTGRRVTREFDMHFTTGVEGFRGTDQVKKKRPGSVRIASFGNSHTFGVGVDDDQVYSYRLEQELQNGGGADIEVINMSVTDTGTGIILAMWDQILQYQPDMIVVRYDDYNYRAPGRLWSVEHGELVRKRPEVRGRVREVMERFQGLRHLESFALYGFSRILFSRHIDSIASLGSRMNPFRPIERGPTLAKPAENELEYALLTELVARCVRESIPLVFATFNLEPARRVEFDRIVDRPGILVLEMDSKAKSPQYYYAIDEHLNALGHEYVAKRLAQLLIRPNGKLKEFDAL